MSPEQGGMLEKALISGVVHQREETVYHVEGATRARLFGALAEALVNVDTIVQTGDGDRLLRPAGGSRRRRADARRARARLDARATTSARSASSGPG